MARRVQSGRSNRTRRKLVWARDVTSNLALAGAGGTTNQPILANFQVQYGAQLIGCTVMRIRGWIKPAVTMLADDFAVAGIRVVTDTETFPAAGGPIADRHADWMWWSVIEPSLGDNKGLHFDVKAMRKIDELGQGLSLIFENSAGSAATNLDIAVSVLVALP